MADSHEQQIGFSGEIMTITEKVTPVRVVQSQHRQSKDVFSQKLEAAHPDTSTNHRRAVDLT